MCFMNLDYRRFRFTLATLFIFTSILLKNSSCHLHRRRFFRSESGCKDKAMIPPFPNFFTIIFHLFFKPPTNTVTGKTLGRKIFTGKTGKTTGKREGKAARPGKGTALSPGKHLSWTPVNVFETSLIRK